MRKSRNLQATEVDKHVSAVAQQMKQLENDLFDLIPFLEKLDDRQKEKLTSNLSLLRSALIQSLLMVSS
ncbi:MerR family transcriptional regulator [Neobacillus sp. Marseille-QA0830]